MKKFSADQYSFDNGSPLPLGAKFTHRGINLAIFSRHAQSVTLVLFDQETGGRMQEIPLDPCLNKTGDIWHVLIRTKDRSLHYGFLADGPYDPAGSGHCFNRENILLDPYARALSYGNEWGAVDEHDPTGFSRRCLFVDNNFEWENDRPLNIPLQDTIIYELHVRGFTRHRSSGVSHPGTYAGIIEKIPYLQKLGITAVELMPIAEFNENENTLTDPTSGEPLKNYWGYSPLAFFAPKAAYAVNGRHGNQVHEFKEMVKALHRAGIEVILDVVFNHTAEGGANGPVISFRGLDNTIYYLLDPAGKEYLNFSGCGNTLNCNHPLVHDLIIDCLRYWVTEMHVDGFRFDLASILGRHHHGEVLHNPPMVDKIAEDPVLANTKIIAEAWDASGLYQVGSFSSNARWAEWNDKFRDDVRAFMCSHENTVPALATRLAGSSDLYQRSTLRPFNSINFITSHDGFTLYDLVSYNNKHNLRNGENNLDGYDNNISWNSGHEGETPDPAILAVRDRRLRTFAVILFFSQGVPMFVAGDEFGRTQDGNNNAYCQDNEISWLDWRLAEKNSGLLRFFQGLVDLRKKHAGLRRSDFFPDTDRPADREISWQAARPGVQDWSPASRILAFQLHGSRTAGRRDDDFFVMLNGQHRKAQTFLVPTPDKNRTWLKIIDTAARPPRDLVTADEAEPVKKTKITVAPMGAVVLVSGPER